MGEVEKACFAFLGEGEMQQHQKSLRARQTQAESLLWYHLRNRHLLELKFRRQVVIGPYIVDFICFEKNLIIELDGGQHNEEPKKAYDNNRTRYLEARGFSVLRFWNNDVIKSITCVLEQIRIMVQSPSPSPCATRMPRPLRPGER